MGQSVTPQRSPTCICVDLSKAFCSAAMTGRVSETSCPAWMKPSGRSSLWAGAKTRTYPFLSGDLWRLCDANSGLSSMVCPLKTKAGGTRWHIKVQALRRRHSKSAWAALICLMTVTPAMGQFALSFRTGPVLSETDQVRIPYPTERHGDWSWAQLTVPTAPGDAPSYEVKSLVKAGQDARLDSNPPALMEGWLTFKPDGKD